jgi:glycosyltransferase involved in cell wall biosynthesis
MAAISVVIITKNEAPHITACVRSAKLISNDIVVVDCGSADSTRYLARKEGARVLQVAWQCYGQSRNIGAVAAKNDWILALDADERVSDGLSRLLFRLELNDSCIYKIKRVNFFERRRLRFGTPGFEKITRLYHRQYSQWDLVPVHEKIVGHQKTRILRQSILHFGIPSITDHIQKKEHYAMLSARKYFYQGKKATFVKRFLAPVFNGIKSYVFQLGFLDGQKGWQIASTITYYTWLKYKLLLELRQENKSPTDESPSMVPNYQL